MTTLSPYPWQQQQWQLFLQQTEADQLPHSLLLTGQKGIGKWHYGEVLAHYLLCDTPKSGLPCGGCKSCLLLQNGNHPDLMLVAPEEAHKAIKIDQIRLLTDFIVKTAQQQGVKVALLGPVEQLNNNAGNALLKSLEEPAGNTLLILTSNVSSNVMATIRSRCQIVSMPKPSRAACIEWFGQLGQEKDVSAILDIAASSPLMARELLEETKSERLLLFLQNLVAIQGNNGYFDLGIAKSWLDIDLPDLLDWWIQLVNLIAHNQALSVEDRDNRYNDSHSGEISSALKQLFVHAAQIDSSDLFVFLDQLIMHKRQQLQGANPNKQLLLEELSIAWRSLMQAKQQVA